MVWTFVWPNLSLSGSVQVPLLRTATLNNAGTRQKAEQNCVNVLEKEVLQRADLAPTPDFPSLGVGGQHSLEDYSI